MSLSYLLLTHLQFTLSVKCISTYLGFHNAENGILQCAHNLLAKNWPLHRVAKFCLAGFYHSWKGNDIFYFFLFSSRQNLAVVWTFQYMKIRIWSEAKIWMIVNRNTVIIINHVYHLKFKYNLLRSCLARSGMLFTL